MKRLFAVLVALMLLAGCSAEEAPETIARPTTAPTEATGFYDPDSLAQSQTGGAVLAYPLPERDYGAVMTLGEKLLLVHTTGKLTALQGDRCVLTAAVETGAALLEEVSFSVSDSSLSYYDEIDHQVVILDSRLMDLARIDLPEDMQGDPAVDLAGKQIYYCQGQELRALDVRTGITRLVMSHRYKLAHIAGIYLDGTVLALTVADGEQTERILYLDCATGEILYDAQQIYALQTRGEQYFLQQRDGQVIQWAFGTAATDPVSLNVENQVYAAFSMSGAVSCSTDGGYGVLDYYDLESGLRTAAVTIPEVSQVLSVTSDSRYIWILGANSGSMTLYRWDIIQSPVVDDRVYTGELFTARNPDREGLALCQERAEELNRQYGIQLRIWEDALAQTGDYEVVSEHQVSTINAMLDELELVLMQYPKSFLRNTIRGGRLNVCLVRSIGGLTNAQFYSDGNAYILLSLDSKMDWDFTQALAYVVDSHVLGNSRDFDDWASLNPKGFAYAYDYDWEPDETAESYLQAENRAFIDALAMTYPHEDRCRIFLYAMQPDMENYFTSDTMQRKLRTLCEGIREAYGLEKSKESMPWEQYLTVEMDFSNF